MDVNKLLGTLSPEIYENLKRAVELGKWPDGRPLTPGQRETCLQAVIAYDLKHKPPHERIGYIPTKLHRHCGGEGEVAEPEAPTPLKWQSIDDG